MYVAARALRPVGGGPRFYFASGGSEGPPGQPDVVVRAQQAMVDSLVAAGFRVGTNVHAVGPADGRHQEWFWRREFPAAYRWLFATPPTRACAGSAARC